MSSRLRKNCLVFAEEERHLPKSPKEKEKQSCHSATSMGAVEELPGGESSSSSLSQISLGIRVSGSEELQRVYNQMLCDGWASYYCTGKNELPNTVIACFWWKGRERQLRASWGKLLAKIPRWPKLSVETTASASYNPAARFPSSFTSAFQLVTAHVRS